MNLRRHTHRGTAMLEFIMVIPLLALIIAGTFFFGQVMRNQQRLRVADRYEAWQGSGESNALLLDGRGESMAVLAGTGPTETLEDLQDAAAAQDPDAGDLAEWVLLNGSPGRFPRGWSRQVDAEFPREVAAANRIENLITSESRSAEPSFGPSRYRRQAREGLTWQRGHCQPGQAVRGLYLGELDETTEAIAGTAIGQALRSLYVTGW